MPPEINNGFTPVIILQDESAGKHFVEKVSDTGIAETGEFMVYCPTNCGNEKGCILLRIPGISRQKG